MPVPETRTRRRLPVGCHVPRADPLGGAAERGAEVIQVNLSAPRNWATPVPHGDEADLAASPLPLFVHAPYVVNPASDNPDIRKRSRKCLEAEAAAACTVGAEGLVVHGGHAGAGRSVADGIAGWLEVLDGADLPCRLLIENTAGGHAAPARHASDIARLFAALRGAGHDVGFVLDTCHAHAAGEDLASLVDNLRDAVGTIDLVHANDSRDPPGSGRDRHAHLGEGTIPGDLLAAVIAACRAPVVVETPGPAQAQARDLAWLRRHIGAVSPGSEPCG